MPLVNVFFWIMLLLGAISVFLIISAQMQAESRARQELARCRHQQLRQNPELSRTTIERRPEFRFYAIDCAHPQDRIDNCPDTPEKKLSAKNNNICA